MTAVFFREARHRYPIAASASGMHIFDDSGKCYLDMSGGAAASPLGHQHPEVVSALVKQIETLSFAHTGFFSNVSQEKLADLLARKFGEEGARAYFTAGGSEANEIALKFAWQYWQHVGHTGKTKIISREHSYHGNTLGALSVSGNPSRRRPASSVLHDWPRIEACYPYRLQKEGESEAEYAARAATALETAILREGANTVAAFIVEPVVGASLGAVTPAHGYFKKIREICDRYDILLIADEIMCGTGRTGSFYAHEQENFLPDMVTLGKGIGGGYQPLAATVVRRKIAEVFEAEGAGFAGGHTYVGHASTCAAGAAVLQAIEHHQLLGAVRQKGDTLQSRLEEEFANHPFIGDIRGRGLFRAIEFVSDRLSKKPMNNNAALAVELRNTAMKHGLICYPSGGNEASGLSCHILFAPPFIVQNDHIDEMTDKLHSVLLEVFGV